MKKLFATHKILSIIVAVAIMLSGIPLSAGATSADATSADNTAIGLSGEIDPDNGEPADTGEEEQQEEQEPDPVDEDDSSVATSGVTVNNDEESCVCTAFQSDPDCPVCKDDATQCFFYYCVCEALCGEDDINHDCPICRDDYTGCVLAVEVPEFAALADATWTDGMSVGAQTITSGTITVTGTVTVTGTLTIDGDVSISGGGTLKRGVGFTGHFIYVSEGASLELNSITIDGGNQDGVTGVTGCLVSVGGELTMESGAVLKNNTRSSGGGGVENYGTFTMNGGAISGNTSSSSGGGVNNGTGGTFNMTGGTISGNTGGNGGGLYHSGTAFTISGSPKIENNIKGAGGASNTGGVYLGSGYKIMISAPGLSAGARIGIEDMGTPNTGTIVATGAAASDLQYFYISNADGMINFNNGFEWSGSNIRLGTDTNKYYVKSNGNDTPDNGTYASPYKTIAYAYSQVPSGGEILVMDTITVSDLIDLTDPKTVTLKSASGTQIIKRGATGNLFTVDSGVTLILENITIDGGNQAGGGFADGGGALVFVESGGALTMNSGAKLQNNSMGNSGGGVYNYGTFTMTGGEISGNTSTYSSGGGVYNILGTFTMSGGEIKNNTAGSTGGGVRNIGTFNMSGGEISSNTASVEGGGVYVSGTFTVGGTAKITGNFTSVTPATPNNVELEVDKYITLGTPAAGMEIYVTKLLTLNDGVFVNSGATQAMVDNNYFKSDDTTKKVELDGDKLKLVTALSPVTITGVSATSRAYNGTTTVALTGGTLSGVDSGDDVGFTLGSGTMADANAGTSKAVTTAITLTGGDANKYTLAQPTNVTVNITPKALTISGISATDRTYNGTTAVALTGTGTLSGIESGDIGSVSAVVPANGTIASANAGTSKTVTTAITLTGGKAGSYTLTQPTVTVDIAKKDININTVEAVTKVYDGNMSATAGAVTFSGMENSETLTLNTDYSVTAAFTDNANAGIGNKNYTYTVTMLGTTKANNYNLTANTKNGTDGTINKAAAPTATTPSAITIISTDTDPHTFDLDTITLTPSSVGTRSYALNGGLGGTTAVLNGSPTLGGTNNATLTYQGAGQTSGSATQSITITTANYENITVTITFTATDKNDVSNSPLFVFTDGSATYDGSPKAHATATYNGSGANITYSYSGTGGTSYGPTATAPTNAGSYTVTAKYEDAANLGTKTVNFTINPRNISNAVIAAIGNQTYTGSAITPTPSMSDSGGTITTNDYTVSYSGNTNVGTATVTLTGKNNYTGTKTATFNIVAIPLTSAAITVTAPAKGGTPNLTANGTGNFGIGAVSWNPGDSVFKGGTAYTATVTLTADSGYTFTGLTTATINGYSATVSNNTGSAVTLSYTFPATSAKTVSGISVKTPPNLVYVAGDKLNLTALIVNVDYDDTTTEDIAYNKTGLTYEIDGTAVTSGTTVLTNSAHDGENIAITYGGKSTNTSALTVYLPISAQIAVTDITAASAKITYSATTDSRNSITSKLQIRSGSAWSDVAGASSPHTAISLTPDTTYEYRVWAKDNTTNKEYIKPVTFKTSAAAPAGITVDGDIIDTSSPAAIWVTLEHGNTVISSAQATAKGGVANTFIFSFSNVPNGIFNLVVDNGSWKVTQAVTVVNGAVTNPVGGITIDMSTGRTQSIVDIVTNDTPPAAVNGLPDLFSDSTIYTTADAAIVTGGGTVEIKLAVEKKDNPADASLITDKASGQSIGMYVDLSVIKSQLDGSGALLGETTLTDLNGNHITITFELPDDLKGKNNLTIYRVHNGSAEALTSTPNAAGETAVISGDIVTLTVCKFSTYAIAYTPSNPNPPSPPSPSGGGSSSGIGGGGASAAVVSTYWIEVAEAKSMATAAKEKKLDYVRSRRIGITGIRKNSLLALAKDGLLYQHDTVIGNAVQVRVYVGDPSKAAKDILVSGYVKGNAVDKTKARFEKWFTNKVAIVSLEQQGDYGMQVGIAAKLDLSGMDTNNLHFYSYDKKANKYSRIHTEYRIDSNGYLHFATILAGDIIVSSGPLTKKTEQQIAAGGNKYSYLGAQSIHEITNNVGGGDSLPDTSEPPVQETPQNPSTEGDSLLYMDTADTPLKLKKVDNQNIGEALVIDLDAPDALAGSQNRKPNALLIGGIAALVLLAAVILWAVVPRKNDMLVQDNER